MQFPCVLDSQRRLAIPKQWRLPTDSEDTDFFISVGIGPSLEFYDYAEFERRQVIAKRSMIDNRTRILGTGSGMNSTIVQLDKQGRFVIPQPLLEVTQIKTNVLCLGSINYGTIIAKEIWEKIQPPLDDVISYSQMLGADGPAHVETKVLVTETQ